MSTEQKPSAPLAPVISISAFQARRQLRAPRAALEQPVVNLILIPQLPDLTDVGVVKVPGPGGAVLVSGIGADLDPENRVQPAYTPGQARLLAERLLAAARTAECASCCAEVQEQEITPPQPVCAACELLTE